MSELYNRLYNAKQEILKRRIINNPYIPVKPTEKQAAFVLNTHTKEILYGGAAGGGKSVALLMAALMFVELPDYSALLLRRSYTQLTLPSALMDLAQDWLGPTDAKWNGQDKQWKFPSGATLNFGYLDTENDTQRYQGAAFQFIGFDELTQFTEKQYTYVAFSRNRKTMKNVIPIRIRAASNPGGVGHDWVKNRFFVNTKEGRLFIPSGLKDNPHLNREDYEQSLQELDPVTRKQLLDGDWDVIQSGNFFEREKFRIIEPGEVPGERFAQVVRYWDLAATEAKKGKDPDYTAGVKILCYQGRYYILDVIKVRKNPSDVQALIRHTAELDGVNCQIFMEQEPGSSGVMVIDHYARNVLSGFSFRGIKTTGSKIDRARPLAAAVHNGNVFTVRSNWTSDFINECVVFPQEGFHDDCVDAASGAFTQVATAGKLEIKTLKINRKREYKL
jgi:predicted phage terminase large subunit-like protein